MYYNLHHDSGQCHGLGFFALVLQSNAKTLPKNKFWQPSKPDSRKDHSGQRVGVGLQVAEVKLTSLMPQLVRDPTLCPGILHVVQTCMNYSHLSEQYVLSPQH